MVRPDLHAVAVGVLNKEPDIRFPHFQSRVFERTLHAGRVEIFNADGEMIDALGFASWGRSDRHIARAEAQVTTWCPAIFQDFIAEETTVEQHGFVDISDRQCDMIHTRGAEESSLGASLRRRAAPST